MTRELSLLAAVALALGLSTAPAGAAIHRAGGPTLEPHVGPTRPLSRYSVSTDAPSISFPSRDHLSDRCRFERGEYRLHHPIRKPRSLRTLHGCPLWRADARYHARTDRLHVVADARAVFPSVAAAILLAVQPHH